MPRQGEDRFRSDDQAIHTDAYIESLLVRPLTPAPRAVHPLDDDLARTIDLLAGLPRFHPSFAFEESLAARLREATGGPTGGLAEVIPLPVVPAAARQATIAGIDRRLLVGGAIASGVSLAGIVYAWLHGARGAVTRERTA
jgi:hypothetical protein